MRLDNSNALHLCGHVFVRAYDMEQPIRGMTAVTLKPHFVSGSGTGDDTGVEGRFHIKDDIEAGNFPYTAHPRF